MSPTGEAAMFEYKVLSERDKAFSGTFDLEVLEKTLNSLATDGWRLAESFLATSIWKSGKSQIVMILERRAGGSTELRQA